MEDGAPEGRILVVDDLPANVRLLERLLRQAGYRDVEGATEAGEVEARVHLPGSAPDLVLLDLHMPAGGGMRVLEALGTGSGPGEPPAVLVLTADTSARAKREALAAGASDFVQKPFDAVELLLRIRHLLATRFLQRALTESNVRLEARVRERTRALEEAQGEVLERLAQAAELRDDDTGLHTRRVGEVAGALAAAVGLPAERVALIRRAAPLHDVGKIGIPDALLRKPEALTREERRLMETHTGIGARILGGGRSEPMRLAEQIALAHHERWDGRGYPAGLRGEEIPLPARIVAVADVFDALSHDRPYRAAWPGARVREEIERGAGSHFDPAVVAAFLAAGDRRG